MSKKDVIRAWKDAEYRNSLTAEELAALPENPAGATELPDSELENVAGAATRALASTGCCSFLTSRTCIGWTVCGLLC